MFDSIDIFTSRRNHFNKCLFWHRFDDEDLSSMVNISSEYGELIYDRSPDGSFYANEVSPYSYESKYIANSFAFDSSTIQLETNDNVNALSQNDLIYFDDNLWTVVSIQRIRHKRQSQYSRINTYKTMISIRR